VIRRDLRNATHARRGKGIERAATSCSNTSGAQPPTISPSSLAYGDSAPRDRAARSRPTRKLLRSDEPAAGMNATETARSKPAREIPSRRDDDLLIEHDMKLVMSVCDRVLCSTTARRSPEGVAGRRAEGPEGDRGLAYLGGDVANP
jgi:branched-chain amino acid transport system ATP-binding protein